MTADERKLTSVEICAGAGGQALGLENAGFSHAALVEIDHNACETLRANVPDRNTAAEIVEGDVLVYRDEVVEGKRQYPGLDLLSGGVPCPPFSMAGKQLGHEDERDLFPAMLDLIGALRPKAVMIENVRGLLQPKFRAYRQWILWRLEHAFCQGPVPGLGDPLVCSGHTRDAYVVHGDYAPVEQQSWRLLNACDYGVPQLRPRSLLVALQPKFDPYFSWPEPRPDTAPSVGEVLKESMSQGGWPGAPDWALKANRIAPTLVGGSKKHGGADLGPTRAKLAWAALGVDAMGVADEVPGPSAPIDHRPKLTVRQTALLQGFPPDWEITGKKTAAYRQVGNAFPPPVAEAVGRQIAQAIRAAERGDPKPGRGTSKLF
ncbi:DNA cytosine methyltransferase [Nocardia beijingensis]|uniref:DNA (cytosine-5-)-methyltransferase n=1 Tax=Nocardia beijingensis TaxID=95162 RepID=A0ABW7WC23_9NOCA